jgi:hypothetical protein
MLEALARLDAPAVSDRVAALDALSDELPQLSRLSEEEWDAKLSEVEDDVADLGEQAERAAELYRQAQRALETLTRLAEREANRPIDRGERPLSDSDGRYENEIAQAKTTREAILRVMLRRPNRTWTAVLVHDELQRFSRPVEHSNVQVTLRRLADAGQLRKVGRGAYHVLPETISLNGTSPQEWLRTPAASQMLRSVAEEAADHFLAAHPGEEERHELVEEALLAASRWTERHGKAPDGEPHVRRLMKSRLYDIHRRKERRGRPTE